MVLTSERFILFLNFFLYVGGAVSMGGGKGERWLMWHRLYGKCGGRYT